jgi:menaquinone-dependent protoporphyrinogen oxidase
MRALVTYASKHGSTREVAESIARTLGEHDVETDLREAAEADSLAGYGAVVLGGSIYTARWHADAKKFVKRHAGTLRGMPVAIFALGYIEPEQRVSCEMQLRRELEQLPGIEPVQVAVFGGRIEPAELRFPFKRMPAKDARDWGEIRRFAETFCAKLPTPV